MEPWPTSPLLVSGGVAQLAEVRGISVRGLSTAYVWVRASTHEYVAGGSVKVEVLRSANLECRFDIAHSRCEGQLDCRGK